jgi:hypothetical protein
LRDKPFQRQSLRERHVGPLCSQCDARAAETAAWSARGDGFDRGEYAIQALLDLATLWEVQR